MKEKLQSVGDLYKAVIAGFITAGKNFDELYPQLTSLKESNSYKASQYSWLHMKLVNIDPNLEQIMNGWQAPVPNRLKEHT